MVIFHHFPPPIQDSNLLIFKKMQHSTKHTVVCI